MSTTLVFSDAEGPLGEGPGFTEALFDVESVRVMLEDEDCTGIRFYNVMASERETTGTVMMIGIRSNGSELNGGFLAKPYKMSDGVRGSQIVVTPLSKSKAGDVCGYMESAGHVSYSTTFAKSEVIPIINSGECNAVKLMAADHSGSMSMTLVPVNFNGDSSTDLEGERTCTEPCPTVCGPPANYINSK